MKVSELWANVPYIADVEAIRRGKPIRKGPSRVSEKDEARKLDEKQLAAFRKAVWRRDKGLCRWCGVKVLKTITLTAKRGEVHHVAGRDDRAVRYDPRNGILLCRSPCHERVTGTVGAKVIIVGAKFFTVNGLARRYIDAGAKVRFSKVMV